MSSTKLSESAESAQNIPRKLSDAQKKIIAGNQHYKCANKPGSNLKRLDKYECPLWQIQGENKGSFDAAGYDIDHIKEFSISHDDSIDNLQALCKSCHSFKTKSFMMDKTNTRKKPKKKIDKMSIEDQLMEIDETEYDINVLREKSQDTLSEHGKLGLEKLNFIESFGIQNTENKLEFNEFVHEFYSKKNSLIRLENFFGPESNIDELNQKDKTRLKIIIDLINRLTGKNKKSYTIDELMDNIDNEQYVEAMKDIAENSHYFTNEEENKSLFFTTKYIPVEDRNNIYYIATVQVLLATCGIHFGRGNRIRKNKKRVYIYSLYVDKQIKNIVEYKHGQVNKVKGFPTIFKPNNKTK